MSFGQLRVYPSSPLCVLPSIPLTDVSIDIEARANAMKTLQRLHRALLRFPYSAQGV
jgi:hypothetical protein